ncbi:E3 ubiquitin-protein ligase UPL1 [Histomonas meleagridis]|uniref:E3 ubiquitin-protein ligase UPL1 n=1 Tax=Histomonas meleagridis TaxID=135588 RepID=UPI0035595FFC|nr:E3 ubiquitin-protein ligase UPL1 [Histomonas meleagridis]KAH0800427.1 E3 ubiquitin-protein ligase UPL1 [Histomonas meleagridis]
MDYSSLLPIPRSIINRFPAFWEIIEHNIEKIKTFLDVNINLLHSIFNFITGYPQLLTFTQKSKYFRKCQKQKISHTTQPIQVRREYILRDSFRALYNRNNKDKMLCNFKIFYSGENGIDAGGLRKDWFTSLVRELFNQNYALFISSSDGRSFQPNPNSSINEDHIDYLIFAGQMIARALIESICVDAHLSIPFLKQILVCDLSIGDLEDADPELYKSLSWMKDNPVDSLEMDFTTDVDNFGQHTTVELIENGRNIKVTDENKKEFIKLKVEHKLKNQIKQQIDAFKEGFYSLIPHEEIRMFSPNELDLMICGIPKIDVEDLRVNCDFQPPYSINHPTIEMLFRVLHGWSNEQLASLLMFITGSSQVPIGGFKTLKESSHPIIITAVGDRSRLPQAHTCMNTLDLPMYKNEKELESKLLMAISECNTFGIA